VTWKLFPNLFTILVGRPGIGKGAAVNPIISILKEANTANILSDRLTMAYVLERLSKGFSQPQVLPAGGMGFGVDHSAIIFSPELAVFVGASGELPTLGDLWDCREGEFDYGTRHKGSFKIKSPCISILAGTSPAWLAKTVPGDSASGGFCRRANFVWAKDKARTIAFPMARNGTDPKPALINDLRHISTLRGEMKLAPDAHDLFKDLYENNNPGDFIDENTASYVTTRWAQTTKLAMVMSASRSDDMFINAEDWQKAADATEKIQDEIRTVFRGIGESDMVSSTDRVLYFIENAKTGYVSRTEILAYNWQHCQSYELDQILLTLKSGGLVQEVSQGRDVLYCVTPGKTAYARAMHSVGGKP
jgi:hypothetical protein